MCGKCSSKMRIPLEHFSSVPVFALSPQTPSPASQSPLHAPSPSLTSTLKSKVSSLVAPELPFFAAGAGSAPTSPLTRRRRGEEAVGGGCSSGPVSLQSTPSAGGGAGQAGEEPTSLPALATQANQQQSLSSRYQKKEFIIKKIIREQTHLNEEQLINLSLVLVS